jgi:hypothetical protein
MQRRRHISMVRRTISARRDMSQRRERRSRFDVAGAGRRHSSPVPFQIGLRAEDECRRVHLMEFQFAAFRAGTKPSSPNATSYALA